MIEEGALVTLDTTVFLKKAMKKLSFWLFAFSHILAPLSIKFSSVIIITSLFG